MMLRAILLLCSAIAASAGPSQQGAGSRRNGNGGGFSPVRELGPSLAASVAGGTIIAVRSRRLPSLPSDGSSVTVGDGDAEDDDCVVVLFRSPIVGDSGSGNLTVSSVFGDRAGDHGCVDNNHHSQRNNQCYHGLTFLPNGPVNFPFVTGASSNNLRVLHAPSGLVVAATGFAPDADHILNVAAGRVFSRISVYDAPSSSSFGGSKSVDPHRLVRDDLSSMMIDAAMSDGGRPLGLQLLVVGQSALSQNRQRGNGSLEMYTIDPSGGWTSYVGVGAAVGRGAEKVRSSLLATTTIHHCETAEEARKLNGWRGALDAAMEAAIEALEGTAGGYTNNADFLQVEPRAKYGAIVIFCRSSASRSQRSSSSCASVNDAIIEECYRKCFDRVNDQKVAAK